MEDALTILACGGAALMALRYADLVRAAVFSSWDRIKDGVGGGIEAIRDALWSRV